MKAEGKLQAASNSEARTRTMKKSYEKLLDPFDPDSEEAEPTHGTHVLRFDDVPSQAEGVPPVRVDLEGDYKQAALRHKFM